MGTVTMVERHDYVGYGIGLLRMESRDGVRTRHGKTNVKCPATVPQAEILGMRRASYVTWSGGRNAVALKWPWMELSGKRR